VLGNHVLAKVVKNKVAAPFTHAEFDIIFGKGVDKVSAILSSAENCGVVTKSGAFYSYGDIKIGHGQGGAVAYLAEHKDILDKIGKETMAKSITVVEVKGAEDEEIPEMPESEIEPVNPETTESKKMAKQKTKILCSCCDNEADWICPVCGSTTCNECQVGEEGCEMTCGECEASAQIP